MYVCVVKQVLQALLAAIISIVVGVALELKCVIETNLIKVN